MSASTPVATVVVPTFNEEANVEPLVTQLRDALAHYEGSGHTVEVLFVDDSHDRRTVDAVERVRVGLRSRHLLVNYIHRTGDDRRGGLAGAVYHGFQAAKSDHIVVMDGDLQHPPRIVPELIEKVMNGTDIVVASRYIPGGSADGLADARRVAVSRTATTVTKMVFPGSLRGISDPMTGFFAVKRKKLFMERLRNSEGFKILLDILAFHPHLKRGEVPLQFEDRHGGDSKADAGNGLKFIKQLPLLRLRTLPTLASFLFGGALFAGLGALLLFLMVLAGVNPHLAFGIQLLVTVTLNFAYNKHFTWYGHTNGTLRRQMVGFGVTRGMTVMLSMLSFPWLVAWAERSDPVGFGLEVHTQVANAVCLVGATVLNFISSRWLFEEKTRRRHWRRSALSRYLVSYPGAATFLVAGISVLCIGFFGFTAWLLWLSVSFAGLSFLTASTELWWRLYGRRDPEARAKMRFPEPVKAGDARLSFTFLVAALREASVIGPTLQRLAGQTHPNARTVATLVEGDAATIDVVEETIAGSPPGKLEMIARTYEKGSKAAQLNFAMEAFPGDDVTDFVCPEDAETEVPEELAAHVESLIRQTGADVVQCAVILTNTRVPRHVNWNRLQRFPLLQRMLRPFFESAFWAMLRSWFVIHNVLEYFFNWSSRAVYQASKGFMLFGGNTIFIRRGYLRKVKGWPAKLTEDAFLAAVLRRMFPDIKIVAMYDPKLAAREETPPRMFGKGGWLFQRVRWVQGFIEVLEEGDWRHLPSFKERALAFYSLIMPLLQGLNGIMLPFAIAGTFLLKAPVLLVVLMFMPFVPTIATVIVQVLGMREFSRDHGVKFNLADYLFLVFASPLYQWVLSLAAVIAIKRHVAKQTHWEKTEHAGTHLKVPAQTRGSNSSELVGAH